MAELIVVMQSHQHPDPKVDREGAYKAGDVVDVREDGFDWGRPDATFEPKFKIVRMPGIPVADLQHLIESEPETLRDRYPRAFLRIKRLAPALQKTIRGGIRRRRKYSFDIATQKATSKMAGV